MNRAGLPPPLTEQAAELEGTWNIFLVIALGVGVIVAGLILFAVTRDRRRTELPRQTREHVRLELVYTALPLAVVVVLFVLTVRSVRAVDDVDPPDAVDLVVDVVAFQWQWQFTYPAPTPGGEPVVVTGVGGDNPELVLPADATVRFDLRAVDVIHSFWIPGFRYKRDVFPNETASFQVDVGSRTGTWPDTGVCAEFCGLDHHKMRFDVRIVTAAEFAAWLAEAEP